MGFLYLNARSPTKKALFVALMTESVVQAAAVVEAARQAGGRTAARRCGRCLQGSWRSRPINRTSSVLWNRGWCIIQRRRGASSRPPITYRVGNFVMGIPFYTSALRWVIALIGLACIILIMMGSTKRLEQSQGERYGALPEYQQYATTVPVLFPFLPVYTLKNVRVLLE